MVKFISISDLTKKLNLIKDGNQKLSNHVLRYWEKEFKQIKPRIINKRRYYSSDQVELIKFIKFLLKDNGMTIKGTKKILNNNKKLDYNKLLGLKADYYKKSIEIKSKNILEKIKHIKTYGKKNTYKS